MQITINNDGIYVYASPMQSLSIANSTLHLPNAKRFLLKSSTFLFLLSFAFQVSVSK